jgi:iron complex outermembrane recepter protein
VDLVNTVGSVGPQNLVNGCYINNVAQYCSQITVGGGAIISINNATTNTGSIVTDGYDLSTHYKFPSSSIGDFKLGLDVTFLKDYNATVPNGSAGAPGFGTGFATSRLAGWVNYPKTRATLGLGWNYGNWSAQLTEYYVEHTIEPCSNAGVSPSTIFPVCTYNGVNGPQKTWSPQGVKTYTALNEVGSVVYTDLEGTYHMDSWNTDFTFGVQNLLDRHPPMSISAFANSYMPYYNRMPGRFFFGRVSVKF